MSTRVFETRGAKLITAVVAVLLLAVFQVAVQARPAHAWEVRIQISGGGQVTETTSANLVGSNCSTPSTTPTGTIGKTCLAGTTSGNYGSAWDVDYMATPASGYSFARWESDGSTRTAIICDRSNPPANSSTYTGATCKFRTFDNLQTRAVFVDTTRPPTPTITSTSPSSNAVNGPKSFNFSITSDPTFKEFQCRVTPTVQTTFQPCTSGVSFNPPDGSYTFEVRSVDWSSNTSFISATHSWTVDKTAPVANITSAPPTFSNSNSATFNLSSNEANTTFQCSRDGGSFGSCSSSNSQSYSGLSDGSRTFSVRAIDQVGNMGNVTSRTWTIDTVLPETTLEANTGPAPDSTTQENDPVFEFSSNEANATFECNLTGPGMTSNAFTACPSPRGYPNLKDGAYTFKVRAKDQATNVDGSPEERTWTINNTPTVLENSLTPVKLAAGVARNTNISATFSEEMATISLRNPDNTSSTFKLQMANKKKKKWMTIPATIALTNTNATATLDPYPSEPAKMLAANKKFRGLITTGAKDADGNPLARNFAWTFTTASS